MSLKILTIFDKQVSRKPDFYPWAKRLIQAIQDSFWTHRLFTFSSDAQDFHVKFDDQKRQIVTRSLALISQVELPVKSFWANVGNNLPHPSIIDMGYTFASNEVVHADAYGQLLNRLGLEDVYDEILKLPIVSDRIDYLTRYISKFSEDKRRQFIYSIILFTIFIENISLFSQFYTISWFGRFDNSLKDTVSQVTYTSREEALHYIGGLSIIKDIKSEFPELFDEELSSRIAEEGKLALQYESNIIKWILGDFHHENLNYEIVLEFIKSKLNKSFVEIGFKPLFDINYDLISKTTWFDEMTLGNVLNDFFHSKPTEYGIANHSFNEDELFS